MDQSKFSDFSESRFGLSNLKKVFLDKPINANLNWLFTLGSVCLFLFVLQALTGIILAMYYVPSPDHAYSTIEYINNELSYGWMVRGIHHWSANFLIVAAIFHLLRSFYYGAYKAPREFTWISGVLLLLLILGFGFTGYLFAWDQRAYWATVVGLNFFTVIPVVGKFISHLFMGGPEVSAITLTHFYTIHILILPLLTVMLAVIHIYLVRLHDISGPIADMEAEEMPRARFYPYHMVRDLVVCLIVFFAILVVASFFKIESQAVAGTWDPSYLPRPEWYFLPLFEALKYFEGKFEIVGVIGIPLLIFGVLVLLPFLGSKEEKKPMNRPVALGVALALIIGIGHLGILGARDNPDYGKEIIVPSKVMTLAELNGIRSYIDRDCAYCHNILGRGGRGYGADLSNVVPNQRKKDWLVKYIKDPKAVLPRAAMPGYDLPNEELKNLAAYMISLDFNRYRDIAIDTKRVDGWSLLHQNNCLSCHKVNGVGLKTGHDLSTEGAKRSMDWLGTYFQTPVEHSKIAKNDVLERLSAKEKDLLSSYLSTLE